ncbi:carboxymuconolactone decarboxylase family protein [uncultured Erythrobacter sp.]|uniref:carboxymuconolactone decarboxylase family protein n=1 Tax=uncultured Erythrobacter sp. TaxID=263913 RepID=UPI00261A4AE6|nr:carboxymuconolactone decarboxylase family protein [uncultured Erythrobacter sp.]
MAVEDLPPTTREALTYAQGIMGFAPNDVLTMAHWPELLEAMEGLVSVIYKPGELDPVLKRLIATITSGAAGCRYCQAHTAHGAVKMAGGDDEKIAKVWEYQSNPLFNAAERAALDLALAAGTQPNAATDAHFRELKKHFSMQQIMEIMGVIGLFGFLNRWNDTLATELEDKPHEFASETYSADVWEPGRHKRD